ncbi:PepSY domain-containing protein [Leucobacter sp. GX24907]
MTMNEPQNPGESQNSGAPQNTGLPQGAEPQQSGDDRPDTGRVQKNRPLIIGAGIAAAIILLGGGGVALGAALGNNDGDGGGATASSEHGSMEDHDDDVAVGGTSPGTDDSAARGDEDGAGSGSDGGATVGTPLAPADADSLTDAIKAALAETSGKGATSIDVERGGWEVDVRLANGTQAEVWVAEDGSAAVRDEDSDPDDDPLLDVSKLQSIIDAALDAAGGGEIDSISTDDGRVRYEVEVNPGNGVEVEVELDESLGVLGVD